MRTEAPTRSIHAIFAAALMLAFAGPLAAQPKSTSLYPAGGQRGTTVEVTVSGSFANWPVEADVFGEHCSVECAKDKGKVRIKLDPAATSGPRWLRFHDKAGSDEWRCFLVDQLPESMETEPNETATGEPLKLPTIMNGKLQKSGDVDVFLVDLQAGQTLVAGIEANRWLKSPIDCVIQVCDAKGFVLAQNDDNRNLDPLVVYAPSQAGRFQVRIFGFPEKPNSSIQFAGGGDMVYRLTLTTGAILDYPLPMAISAAESSAVQWRGWNLQQVEGKPVAAGDATPSVVLMSSDKAAGFFAAPVVKSRPIVASAKASVDAPQLIELPALISGEIESPGDQDVFRFIVKKGQRIRCAVEAFDLGFTLDPILTLRTSEGKVLKELDDASRSQRDPVFTITAPADGELHAEIRDTHGFGGPRHAYRLAIEIEEPSYRLTTNPHLSVQAGKEAELVVNVERVAGWKSEIQVSIEGLPEGVKAEPQKLDAKAKSVKLKLVADKSAKPFSGIIKIKGTSGELEVVADYAVDRFRSNSVRLTITAAK